MSIFLCKTTGKIIELRLRRFPIDVAGLRCVLNAVYHDTFSKLSDENNRFLVPGYLFSDSVNVAVARCRVMFCR
jgi:hypothetical protein